MTLSTFAAILVIVGVSVLFKLEERSYEREKAEFEVNLEGSSQEL